MFIPNSVSVVAGVLFQLMPIYIAIELSFCVLFHKYLVPRANNLVRPQEYRDYGNDRTKLLVRILRRIEATCAINNENVQLRINNFLEEWFHVPVKEESNNNTRDNSFPDLSETPSSSPENSDDDASQTLVSSPASSQGDLVNEITTSCLYKEDMDDFFAWAFFGKHFLTLMPWEMRELDKMYGTLKKQQNISFPKKPRYNQKNGSFPIHSAVPRCMTLEPVNAIHRPLFIYILVAILKVFAGLALRCLGYRRLVASTGLVAWYKSGKSGSNECSYTPILFFHGIAPSGFVLYLPMLLLGLATEPERPVLLVENRPISCCIDFAPLSEKATVEGIIEMVENTFGSDQPLAAVGHSFGSCTVSWLLASKLSQQIRQIVLLDPVSILLSEPDVMVNFLYAQEINKIRMVVSSELFTEFYLRRHFAWYNSEMWLDDLSSHHQLLVFLSDQDEIINARKVRRELERHATETSHNKPKTVYWENLGHGDCISSPSKWREIKSLMLQQELDILRR